MNSFASILTEIVTPSLPIVLQLVGGLLATLIGLAANMARKRWGIEIEARHRDALHSALMSGIEAAFEAGATGEDAVQAAVQHAKASVPDAVAALIPGNGVLEAIARSKARGLIAKAIR